jgi:hypothetical protein
MRTILVLASVLFVATPLVAVADTFTEEFEMGSNVGGWTFGNDADTIESEGGNPGGWFHNDNLNTFAPIFRCEYYGAMFTGNYVEMGVSRISGDFITLVAMNGTAWYPFALLLRNTRGTPENVEDDDYVYWVDDINVWCPQLGEGWTHYDFDIPCDFVGEPQEVPEGWFGGSYENPEMLRPDVTWQDVLTSIDRVEFWWFHPAWFGIFTWWEVGADNVTIEWSPGGVATQSETWGGVKALYAE